MNDRMKHILKNFDENQIREINRFLNSDDGRRLKESISERDKEELLKRIGTIDSRKLKDVMSRMSPGDLARIMKKF